MHFDPERVGFRRGQPTNSKPSPAFLRAASKLLADTTFLSPVRGSTNSYASDFPTAASHRPATEDIITQG